MNHLLKRVNFSPYFPFNAAKWPFFYGWIILGAGVFGVLMSLPGQTTGISVFTDHLIENYRIDRVWFTVAYFIGTAGSGFLVRHAGKLYDKIGVRPTAIGAALVLSGTLVLLSQLDKMVNRLSQLFGTDYQTWLLIVLLTPLFLFLRLSGQGVTTLISRNMVMKWFEARRGFANIFLGITITLGFNATPKFFDEIIKFSSWRQAWLWMALFLVTVYMIIIVIFFRDNPRQIGLFPDGKTSPKKNISRKTIFSASGEFTLKEARQTREFWLYTLTLGLLGLFFTGFTLNFESIFDNQGLTKELAMHLFILSGIASLFFQFLGNWLSDYISLRYYLPLASLFIITNILAVPFLKDQNIFYYIFIVSLGANSAFFSIFTTITWPRIFGTTHVGEISGASIGIVVIASAIGPLLMSLSNKLNHSYHFSFYLCAAVGFLLLTLSFTARDERTIKRG
jgi:OFA family oxalate/formate antiporter-like MFS transporter